MSPREEGVVFRTGRRRPHRSMCATCRIQERERVRAQDAQEVARKTVFGSSWTEISRFSRHRFRGFSKAIWGQYRGEDLSALRRVSAYGLRWQISRRLVRTRARSVPHGVGGA
eukprot:3695201-Rhodomonas_salina.2